MTLAELKKLAHLAWDEIKFWDKLNPYIARKLDAAIPYIGKVKITSTWRAGTYGFHPKGLAIDFRPIQKSLWETYEILRQLGFKRIGIDQGQKIIHIDAGVEAGQANPYYFYEKGGKDQGPLDAQPVSTLSMIDGYGRDVGRVSGEAFSAVSSVPYSVVSGIKNTGVIGAITIGLVMLYAWMKSR